MERRTIVWRILRFDTPQEAVPPDEGERYCASERSYGSSSRAFTLPEGVDGEHIRAGMKDGVLSLVLPMRPEVQPRRIRPGRRSETKGQA